MTNKHLAFSQAEAVNVLGQIRKARRRPCILAKSESATTLRRWTLAFVFFALATLTAWAVPFPTPTPTPIAGHGSAPIYADLQAGSDMCAKIVTAMKTHPGGAWIQIPAGRFVCTTQLMVPNDGQNP